MGKTRLDERETVAVRKFSGNIKVKLLAGLLAVCAAGRWAVLEFNQQLLNKRWRYA